MHAATVGGETEVRHVTALLREGGDRNMAMLGARTIAAVMADVLA